MGGLYCRINLKWDCNKRTLYISIPGYNRKQLSKLQTYAPRKPQYAPYPTAPRKYGATSQDPMSHNTAQPATKYEITHIQQVGGSILYYTRALDLTVLVSLSTIARE